MTKLNRMTLKCLSGIYRNCTKNFLSRCMLVFPLPGQGEDKGHPRPSVRVGGGGGGGVSCSITQVQAGGGLLGLHVTIPTEPANVRLIKIKKACRTSLCIASRLQEMHPFFKYFPGNMPQPPPPPLQLARSIYTINLKMQLERVHSKSHSPLF